MARRPAGSRGRRCGVVGAGSPHPRVNVVVAGAACRVGHERGGGVRPGGTGRATPFATMTGRQSPSRASGSSWLRDVLAFFPIFRSGFLLGPLPGLGLSALSAARLRPEPWVGREGGRRRLGPPCGAVWPLRGAMGLGRVGGRVAEEERVWHRFERLSENGCGNALALPRHRRHRAEKRLGVRAWGRTRAGTARPTPVPRPLPSGVCRERSRFRR